MSSVCSRCDARAGASRVGRQEFALSHPRIYPTPASQGAGLWNHPCIRGPLFLVPVFFTDWPPVVEPVVRRSWTELAWAFVRRSKPFRSVPTSGRFANQRGIRPRSSSQLATGQQTKDAADYRSPGEKSCQLHIRSHYPTARSLQPPRFGNSVTPNAYLVGSQRLVIRTSAPRVCFPIEYSTAHGNDRAVRFIADRKREESSRWSTESFCHRGRDRVPRDGVNRLTRRTWAVHV